MFCLEGAVFPPVSGSATLHSAFFTSSLLFSAGTLNPEPCYLFHRVHFQPLKNLQLLIGLGSSSYSVQTFDLGMSSSTPTSPLVPQDLQVWNPELCWQSHCFWLFVSSVVSFRKLLKYLFYCCLPNLLLCLFMLSAFTICLYC